MVAFGTTKTTRVQSMCPTTWRQSERNFMTIGDSSFEISRDIWIMWWYIFSLLFFQIRDNFSYESVFFVFYVKCRCGFTTLFRFLFRYIHFVLLHTDMWMSRRTKRKNNAEITTQREREPVCVSHTMITHAQAARMMETTTSCIEANEWNNTKE